MKEKEERMLFGLVKGSKQYRSPTVQESNHVENIKVVHFIHVEATFDGVLVGRRKQPILPNVPTNHYFTLKQIIGGVSLTPPISPFTLSHIASSPEFLEP